MQDPNTGQSSDPAAYRRSLRARRRAAGLCPTCGKPSPDRVICPICSERTARCSKRIKAKLKESRVCIQCRSSPAEAGKGRCTTCLEDGRRRAQQYREERAKAATCGRCGAPRAPGKKKCQECLDRDGRFFREVRESGRCWYCPAPAIEGKTFCAACRVRVAERGKRKRRRLRDEVFAAYGGARCACCGETEVEFLQIDHIDGDGAAHRRELGASSKLYRWLKREGFPAGFQILCCNCNFAKGKLGYCPHRPP